GSGKRPSLAPRDLCLHPFADAAALVRDRNVHAFCLRPRSRKIHRATCLHRPLCRFAFHALIPADTLGIFRPTDRTGRIASVAFRSFCGLRDNLSIGRTALADHSEMDGTDSGRNLHPAIAGLSFLDGSGRPVDEYRCRILFCPPAWGWTRVNLVGEFQSPVEAQTKV